MDEKKTNLARQMVNWDTLPPMPRSRVSTRKPLIVGHRGAAGLAPGNTMAAFHLAAELGVDGIEFDIHCTADGHLIVIHNASVEHTAGEQTLIADLTLDEIKALDVGRGEHIPTLREVFDFVKQTDVLIFPEIKDPWRYLGIESDLAEMIRTYDLVERTQVRSFDHPALHALYWLAPEITISELWADRLPADHEVSFKTINALYTLYTPDNIAQIHARGQQATAWTVNDPDIARELIAAGIDGLTTDYPDRLLPLVDG